MTSGKQARAERQAKIAAAKPKESRTKLWLGLAIALIAVLGIGAVIFSATRSSDTPAAPSNKAFPTGANGPSGGIVVNAGGLKPGLPTLDIYQDFQCPACKSSAMVLGPVFKDLAASNKANVVYHLKSFLDDNLRNDSSKRAGIAAACAADAGKFQEFHDLVFTNQPAEEGTGYTDAQMSTFAGQAGISGAAMTTWNSCVNAKQYTTYLKNVEDASARAGVNSTPTYRVNGKTIEFTQAKSQQDYIAQFNAAFQKLSANPSAAPSASR